MSHPNDDLATKVELAVTIVKLEREIASLKERLLAAEEGAKLTGKFAKLLDDNSSPFERNFKASLGKQAADFVVVGLVILGLIVVLAVLITPH
jgi:hypothetical protein